MSRCFPYPPPGYVRDGARGETVIESIKLQRAREKAITEYSKEKTREKKERRKGKKENKVYKFHQGGKSLLPKERDDEAERSGLTEEHEQPVCSQSLCDLSDGTQSKRNRKLDHMASNDGKSPGNIIRIRLPLRKNREPDVSPSGEQLRTTSGRADSLCQQNEIVCTPGQEGCSSTNSKTGAMLGEPTSRAEKTSRSLDSKRKNERRKSESPYKALIEDWVPPSLQFEQKDFEDQEWLFGRKKQERDGYKRFKSCHEDVSCLGSSTLWPCSHYLPEADVYALPYTLPF